MSPPTIKITVEQDGRKAHAIIGPETLAGLMPMGWAAVARARVLDLINKVWQP